MAFGHDVLDAGRTMDDAVKVSLSWIGSCSFHVALYAKATLSKREAAHFLRAPAQKMSREDCVSGFF